MAKLTINYTNGALTGTATNTDHISSLVIAQSGITTANITGITSYDGFKMIQITSLPQAEAAGITSTLYPVINYQIGNFFEMKSDGLLYLAILDNPTGSTYTELPVIQKATEGTIKQFGIFDTRALSTTVLANINTQLVACKTAKMPAVAVVGMDSHLLNYSGLTDLQTASYSNVSVMVGQDGDSTLYTSLGISIPEVGAVLGAIASAPVQESAAYFRNYTYDNITTSPALGNGVLIKNLADSYLATNVYDKNYMAFQKVVGSSSVYLAHTNTATAVTDDYRSIQLNRVINKAARGINLYLSQELNAPIELKSDGKIAEARCFELEDIAATGLKAMKAAGELSDFSVYINPDQSILTTSNLQVVAKIVPFATANEITVTLGFAASLA
jgi:hypothetical protein